MELVVILILILVFKVWLEALLHQENLFCAIFCFIGSLLLCAYGLGVYTIYMDGGQDLFEKVLVLSQTL